MSPVAADFASPERAPTAVPELAEELVAVALVAGAPDVGGELVDEEEPQPAAIPATKPEARNAISARFMVGIVGDVT
jgi:hypothetical protein